MNQRSSSANVSEVDAQEAYQIGRAGAEWVREGMTGYMVSIERKPTSYYTIDLTPVKLEDVITEGERLMPLHFIENREAYFQWLAPLLGGDHPSYPPLIQRRVEYSET